MRITQKARRSNLTPASRYVGTQRLLGMLEDVKRLEVTVVRSGLAADDQFDADRDNTLSHYDYDQIKSGDVAEADHDRVYGEG